MKQEKLPEDFVDLCDAVWSKLFAKVGSEGAMTKVLEVMLAMTFVRADLHDGKEDERKLGLLVDHMRLTLPMIRAIEEHMDEKTGEEPILCSTCGKPVTGDPAKDRTMRRTMRALVGPDEAIAAEFLCSVCSGQENKDLIIAKGVANRGMMQ
ncbi:hypothetical protein [Mesorhizobium sp.]|uniref:hypothetical protein n=1 Tax=Mesorhizobium sp. TaxID=1871066 RepID=UPI000FE5A94B|nr:hypothetical protein [Mesorhizobium sp.]RWP05079.1 MAG: hypothetical protein EOQ99_16545 [Mesorhizobium sp.]